MSNMYLIGVVASSACMMITGFILAMVKTPDDARAVKLRRAKHALTVAVFILCGLNILQMTMDDEGTVSYLGACFALSMSYLQAMLFTMALLVLIRPEEVTRRIVGLHLAAIIAVDAVLIGSFFLLKEQTFLYIYEFGVFLYLLQLSYYIHWLRRSRTLFLAQIEQYYEEEEISRSMRWVYVLFWAAITVALLALLMMLNNRLVDMSLTILLALFYAFFAACFINYSLSAPIILPVLFNSPTDAMLGATPKERRGRHEAKRSELEQWINDKGYLRNDMAVADIARQVGMSVDDMHSYFRNVVGEEFRTWRVRRRIDEARQLMADHPDYSTTQIYRLCGFNDRTYFYQQFLRFTGSAVADYREHCSDEKA